MVRAAGQLWGQLRATHWVHSVEELLWKGRPTPHKCTKARHPLGPPSSRAHRPAAWRWALLPVCRRSRALASAMRAPSQPGCCASTGLSARPLPRSLFSAGETSRQQSDQVHLWLYYFKWWTGLGLFSQMGQYLLNDEVFDLLLMPKEVFPHNASSVFWNWNYGQLWLILVGCLPFFQNLGWI